MLKQHTEPFKIELTNRFHQLPTENINEWNKQIIITKECAIKAAGKQKKQKDPGLPSEIKNLIDQRRNMKRASVKNQIEYAELCKAIRKKIRENTRAKNMELINKTIEQNQSLKRLKKQTKYRSYGHHESQ